MDDLDHSMHIAEYDWMSFYEESEECGLLQPSLACPDNLSLSDSEDSRKSSSIFDIGRQELQQSPAANSDEAESSAAGWCMEDMQINHRVSEGEQDNLMTKAEEDRERMVKSDKCIDYPVENTVYTEGMHMRTAEHNTVVKHDDVTTTLQTVQLNVLSLDRQSTELTKQYGDMQTESDPSFLHEHGHVSGNQTELNVNEPHTRDAAVSDSVGSGTLTAEKERWFVTVDASSVKNKKRPQKTCKNNHTCQTLGQEKSYENGLKSEINNEPEGGRDSQSNQHSGCSAEEHPGSFQIGIFSDSSQISLTPDEGNSLSDELVTSHVIEPMIDRNKHVPRSLASTSQDTLKAKDPSRLDSVESDELGDSVEFLSIHSCDSESYLSASESVEDTPHLLMENQQLQSSSSVAKNSSLSSPTENTDADETQDRQRFSSHNTLSCNVTATNCEICNVKPTLTFPSAAQSVNKMPDDNSCDNDRHCLQLCVASDTPGLQKHEINLSPSGCSPGDEMSLPFVSDETPTLRSVVSSPETYAVAAGQTRPVYAISAFWDEMEKLTINDILQLRICRETLPSDTQETVTQHVEDFPTNCSPLVDTVEYNLSDAALMDTSDTADSDYCTQLDESKPDCSSCEFSTSDFEEEYWHFLVASRNSSPDPHSKKQHRTIDCPFFVHEEEESTASEGRETPVPSKECFEDQDSDALISLAWPRRITKSESVWNVQALNTEDLSLLGNDESSLFLNSCPSLEENVLLKRSDSLGTLIPAHFLSNTTSCVTVYNPDNIFVAPVFDYTLCTFRDETSFSFLHDSQCIEKPIPIFSCCHPTVREFTFSNQDYILSTDYEERDDFSQIKVGSRSFIQASDCGMSAAALRGSCTLKSLLSRRKISFHDKGSIWSRGYGAWVFPVEAERNTSTRAEPSISVVTEGKGYSTPSQLCREVAVQQRILETIKTTRQEGIFSTLKQSDMCLVCIAFASWVLRSSDPEAADAWKAVLLANVSALSAIQYLRQYVKKNPSQEDP